jgi:hypothetical protein
LSFHLLWQQPELPWLEQDEQSLSQQQQELFQ